MVSVILQGGGIPADSEGGGQLIPQEGYEGNITSSETDFFKSLFPLETGNWPLTDLHACRHMHGNDAKTRASAKRQQLFRRRLESRPKLFLIKPLARTRTAPPVSHHSLKVSSVPVSRSMQGNIQSDTNPSPSYMRALHCSPLARLAGQSTMDQHSPRGALPGRGRKRVGEEMRLDGWLKLSEITPEPLQQVGSFLRKL